MNTIKMSTAIDNYDGLIIRCNGKYDAQNSNDMGAYFEDYEEMEKEMLSVVKKIKVPSNIDLETDYVFLLVESEHQNDISEEESFDLFDSLGDAIDWLISCYE